MMHIERPTDEHFHGSEAVEAEAVGIGLSKTDEGPIFAITMATPGGGRVFATLDGAEMVAYCAEALHVVAEAMNNWEAPSAE